MNPASTVALLAVLAAGFGTLVAVTDGFTHWTTESARRAELVSAGSRLPAAQLSDDQAMRLDTATLDDQLVLLNFVYTRCSTVCRDLGASFRHIQDTLPPAVAERVTLLSVSFDAASDTPEMLEVWLRGLGAQPGLWRAARVDDPAALARWLDHWQVQVIDDGLGGYVHNAAVYVVDRGVLVGIHDPGAHAEILRNVRSRLGAAT